MATWLTPGGRPGVVALGPGGYNVGMEVALRAWLLLPPAPSFAALALTAIMEVTSSGQAGNGNNLWHRFSRRVEGGVLLPSQREVIVMNGFWQEKTIVAYKGRQYELLGIGPTKYGVRARLRFLNSNKEFLVKKDAIEIVKVEGVLITDEDLMRRINEL
jgi:hypothetical protein